MEDPIALSKKMAAFIRERMGEDVPVYRDITLFDDETFQIKVVHTFDSGQDKRRVCFMYTSSTGQYALIDGNLVESERWVNTMVREFRDIP